MTAPGSARPRGRLITIEGPEGSGKTTQAERLAGRLRAAGLEVVGTREPGGTALGERLRTILLDARPAAPIDPLADALLFNAARRQLVGEVIEPALRRGATVVCARFADSTLAYQGYGAGLDRGDLEALARVATGGLRPDLTILLDLPAEVGLRRKAPADLTRFETAFDLDFHRRVRAGFLDLAAAEPRRFAVIDAEAAPDAVEAAVWAAVGAIGTGRSSTLDESAPDPTSEPNGPIQRIHP